MEFTALEPWKLTALMLAGGVFSLAGLWLIFRPKTDGQSMVIHLAGMKFEASSAGILVFLIGAGFFATPLFVQEREAARRNAAATGSGGPSGTGETDGATATTPSNVALSSPGNSAVSEPVDTNVRLEGTEAEPNDTPASANVISLGSTVQGSLEAGNRDFFYVETPAADFGEIAVNATSGDFTLRVYDDLGAEIWDSNQYGWGSRVFRGAVDHRAYYISVETWKEEPRDYDLTVAARPK